MNLEPPREGTHKDLKALIKYVNAHAGPQEYAVIKEHSKKYKDGKTHKVNLRCDQGGVHKEVISQAHRKRATGTQLTECPFKINALLKPWGGVAAYCA